MRHTYTTRDSCWLQLKADLDLIKQMGFNSVRFVGLDVIIDEKTGALSMSGRYKNEKNVVLPLTSEENYNKYFAALDGLFEAVDKAGLKAVFLNKVTPDNAATEDHLRKLVTHLKDNPAILAYDFFNEPLYFDSPERPKKEVYEMMKRWNHIQKMYAPQQLSTIGLEGIREVFEWDPNILDVDFVSFHPYEYEPEQVRNEIAWYGKYVTKPWIIGETAIPADGDSVSYEEQRLFAKKTLKQARDCGASGYSWWQYKDVDWQAFHANFMGVVNLKGETKAEGNNFRIVGTPKPIVQEFKSYDPAVPREACAELKNYYNYSQHHDCRIKGRLLDKNNEPIVGGVILGWNEWWSHSYHTITQADGSFELLGDFPFFHWMASATEFSMVRGDVKPDTAKKQTDGIPTMRLGDLKLQQLDF